jgi:hypothetical protein
VNRLEVAVLRQQQGQGIQAEGTLEVRVVKEGRALQYLPADYKIAAPGVEGYIIGRSDSSSSYAPDIDLAEHGAQNMGVSRRHAVLIRHRGLVHVMDLDSVNGTFMNGKRLSPQIPYLINSGDQISLANMDIVITRGSG